MNKFLRVATLIVSLSAASIVMAATTLRPSTGLLAAPAPTAAAAAASTAVGTPAATPSAVAAPAAAPATPAVYGVLSLIGDKLTIIVAQPQIGSNLDPNRRRMVPIEEAVFDSIALRATVEAVRATRPAAELAAINTRSPVLFEKQRDLFIENSDVLSVPAAIMEALQAQQATHLILIAKHRDETKIQLANIADGAGRLEGLGFFLDGSTETRNVETGQVGRGYISPFAYFRVTLIELPSRKIISRRNITASMPFTSGRAPAGDDPWTALTPTEKVQAIEVLIKREIARVLPSMLTP